MTVIGWQRKYDWPKRIPISPFWERFPAFSFFLFRRMGFTTSSIFVVVPVTGSTLRPPHHYTGYRSYVSIRAMPVKKQVGKILTKPSANQAVQTRVISKCVFACPTNSNSFLSVNPFLLSNSNAFSLSYRQTVTTTWLRVSARPIVMKLNGYYKTRSWTSRRLDSNANWNTCCCIRAHDHSTKCCAFSVSKKDVPKGCVSSEMTALQWGRGKKLPGTTWLVAIATKLEEMRRSRCGSVLTLPVN